MLSLKQERFVNEYLVDMNATRAAIRAGYSPRTAKSQASRLLSYVDLQREITRKQAETSLKLEISREDVVLGLLSANELAREQGDPSTMIRGAAELNKMLGFYAPITSNNDKSDADNCHQKQLQDMSDKELIGLFTNDDIAQFMTVAKYVAKH